MRYYSTQRPIMPGSYPKPAGNPVVEIRNFDARVFCGEIGREAWGYIEYEQALFPGQAQSYLSATRVCGHRNCTNSGKGTSPRSGLGVKQCWITTPRAAGRSCSPKESVL